MSKKKDFGKELLEADMALQNCKIKKVRRDKTDKKQHPESPQSTVSAEIYTFNDSDDVEQDLCVVEVHGSMSTGSNYQSCDVSEANFIEMSAAEKLKSQTAAATASNANSKAGNKKRRTRRGSGTSSEEERWLDAIESGKLEQVEGELKKNKDPKLMTARQRAMYERSIEKDTSPAKIDEILLALPTGYKEKVMTAEAIEKAQLISKKRKQLADERREKNKRETMDRLLKKQESKVTKVAKSKIVKITVPVITYYDSISNGSHISYPIEMEFPMKAQPPRQPPATILCGICQAEQKRYNCSKTNTPLCSIQCYKLNLQQKQVTVQSA